MGLNKLTMDEKSRALTLLEKGWSVICVAADLEVTRRVIYNMKQAASGVPPGTTPPRKKVSGAPRKTSPRTDKILKREVLATPAISRRTEGEAPRY